MVGGKRTGKISLLDVKQEVIVEDNKNLETQNEEQSGQEPKTFTQEEVDEIVRKRLARERNKANTEESAKTGTDREKELDARELRIMAREKLQAEGMPMELADVLKYSDDKALDEAIKKIKDYLCGGVPKSPKSWGQRQSKGGTVKDPIRKAMGLDH